MLLMHNNLLNPKENFPTNKLYLQNYINIISNQTNIFISFLPLTPLTNCKCFDVVTRSSIKKTRKLAGINANANIIHIAVNNSRAA